MTRTESIKAMLEEAFSPIYLELENESHKHSVPPGSETHFRTLIVSEKFAGLSRVERSRMVNDLLKQEFLAGLHAFAQRTYTPQEWQSLKGSVDSSSPPCVNKKS
jgi:stress-induced morphogen